MIFSTTSTSRTILLSIVLQIEPYRCNNNFPKNIYLHCHLLFSRWSGSHAHIYSLIFAYSFPTIWICTLLSLFFLAVVILVIVLQPFLAIPITNSTMILSFILRIILVKLLKLFIKMVIIDMILLSSCTSHIHFLMPTSTSTK